MPTSNHSKEAEPEATPEPECKAAEVKQGSSLLCPAGWVGETLLHSHPLLSLSSADSPRELIRREVPPLCIWVLGTAGSRLDPRGVPTA